MKAFTKNRFARLFWRTSKDTFLRFEFQPLGCLSFLPSDVAIGRSFALSFEILFASSLLSISGFHRRLSVFICGSKSALAFVHYTGRFPSSRGDRNSAPASSSSRAILAAPNRARFLVGAQHAVPVLFLRRSEEILYRRIRPSNPAAVGFWGGSPGLQPRERRAVCGAKQPSRTNWASARGSLPSFEISNGFVDFPTPLPIFSARPLNFVIPSGASRRFSPRKSRLFDFRVGARSRGISLPASRKPKISTEPFQI
ncbi:MAG TPA: hypothetical protein VMH00_02205 [Candidatus Limnocylindrales bacterium]|nr:hypothetical protein [Candidatus Limnocylindrales bacterium]